MMIGVGVYVKNSADAVEFYKKVFGLELGYHVKNADGSYFHSELYKDGKEVLSVVENKEEIPVDNIVCLGYTFESEAEVRRAYDLLRNGGKVRTPLGPLPWSPCAANVVDKFGVWWFLTVAQHQPSEDFTPENAEYLDL